MRTRARSAEVRARIKPLSMDAFLISTGIVALAEIGDKTQLLVLAALWGTVPDWMFGK
jgi:hypothetical protein